MNPPFQTDPVMPFILDQTGARRAQLIETVQTLWSGYGHIQRYQLFGIERQTLIAKHIHAPLTSHHPRGWNTPIGHRRKLQSYQVETRWYQAFAASCPTQCKVPVCLGIQQNADRTVILLEDLDNSGFSIRADSLSVKQLKPCLSWLAHFHATFMGDPPNGLWSEGTYWHLDTRPDEWAAMENGSLKEAAYRLDAHLKQARFRTLVHGDAKVANFCFSKEGQKVAAVDFQYVGGGCGMKDVAYFLGSCLTDRECEQYDSQCLEVYFQELKTALHLKNKRVDFTALEQEWRTLYPIAWADFYRFLAGWMPTHKKINDYGSRLTTNALLSL